MAVKPAREWLALGDALFAYPEPLAGVIAPAAAQAPDLFPRAAELLRLAPVEVDAGRWLPLEAALPVYLREADAWRRA